MAGNRSRSLASSLFGGFEERVVGSPVWGPVLVISCAVALNALVLLPATPAGSVPRLLWVTVAVAARVSALYALSYAVMSRLARRRTRQQMDKNELEVGRPYHRLLDVSRLNPQRHLF